MGVQICYGMEMNVEKSKVMRKWRQPSPLLIMLDQQQLENVKYFSYMWSQTRRDSRASTNMPNAAFKKKTLLINKLDWHLRQKLKELLHLEHSFVWCSNLDNSETKSKMPWTFWNVVLEKDGENQFDRLYEEWGITQTRRKGTSYIQWNKGRITGFVTSFIGAAF
jgi:hypothetical protein